MAGAEFGPDSVCWVEELSFPGWYWHGGEGSGYPGSLAALQGGSCSWAGAGLQGVAPTHVCQGSADALRQRACNKVEMCRL